MKKLIFAFIAILSMSMEAQNIADAVRYSSTHLNGTARFRAMSGAFGALGGDFSALEVNPSGSAVFLNSVASLTLGVDNLENEVGYMNGFTSNSSSNFNLGQGGLAMVFLNKDENSDWRKFTLAFNYHKTSDFEDDYIAAGRNSSSISQYFLEYAQGLPLDLLVPFEDESPSDLYSYLGENEDYGAQQAFLAHYGGVIIEENPDNLSKDDPAYYDLNSYSSRTGLGMFDQEYSYAATGLNGKFSFNFATQYQEFLYLGLNLNSHFINYDRVLRYYEANDNPGSDINEIYFEDRLSTLGSGFSLQLGALTRIGENFRAGISYETPTWFEISEETSQYLETNSNASGRVVVDPKVINVYPDYKLQTPARYTGSLAYLFGSRALLSFDYSYRDFSTTKFKPKGDPDFAFQNKLMETELKGASTYRIGGEYRIEGWSLRGGYRFEESPYSNEMTIEKLQGYSLGLGYNFGNIKIDFAFDTYDQERNPRLFETGLTDRANIYRKNSNYVLSLSFDI